MKRYFEKNSQEKTFVQISIVSCIRPKVVVFIHFSLDYIKRSVTSIFACVERSIKEIESLPNSITYKSLSRIEKKKWKKKLCIRTRSEEVYSAHVHKRQPVRCTSFIALLMLLSFIITHLGVVKLSVLFFSGFAVFGCSILYIIPIFQLREIIYQWCCIYAAYSIIMFPTFS